MTLRELQKKIADDVEEYLDNTVRCNREEGRRDYAVDGITMDDIRLAIQTSDVGGFISEYVEDELTQERRVEQDWMP